ncbi:hypothetical protein ACEQ8H_001723 [Pleosporales sp. CAS-2024a]
MAAVASQPPHGQQQYYQQRPARRPSNGASPTTPTSPQTHPAPAVAVAPPATLTTPRAPPLPLPPSTQSSPAAAPAAGPMPPPRSSSHRTAPAAPQRDDAARRREKESPARSQPQHSRSASAVGQPPSGTSLPREESTVISRIVVADPQEDIARAEVRQAEGRSAASGAHLTPITGLGLVGSEGVDDGGRGAAARSRQDHSKSENSAKRSKFGNYILGQTLGEGEFGKVKMGWKRDSTVEVAIKLIRRETLGSNSNRLQKIYREIQILRQLDHPNIVRLHEMVETERHISIILEYASGGELFDYILNHRYLKDGPARKLFSQLISGVGYLHCKGIVHRDLKLENLLLDRNKNIIITDFGFANTFDPNDELSEEVEYRLGDKDFIKSIGLDGSDATRRGDLMQTSCGSPCYAAPELVVSDSLYTGRKVDVWSCGVILYAMLAGYLPFDDDPANPEGDNINLLYKYIVSTPLTFPEYVTPHARDLLKRILVPDPRKRADLFEVARHSWLADYSHVVGFITSSNTTANEAQQGSVYSSKDTFEQQPPLARSASVREPGKPHTAPTPAHGGLTAKREQINSPPSEKPKTTRDNKRRTVQVEYVAPQSQTQRGEASSPSVPASGPSSRVADEPVITDGYHSATGAKQQRSGIPTAGGRPRQEIQRSVSDHTAFGTTPTGSAVRPSTGGALGGGTRLPSRGNSYGQPSLATVAPTNAEGRFSQPKGKQYSISAPYAAHPDHAGVVDQTMGQPSTQRGHSVQLRPSVQAGKGGGHRRSNTVTETLGRMTSMFSGRQSSYSQDPKESMTSQNSYAPYPDEKKQKHYPPTSMAGPISNDAISTSRQSTDSGRRSFGFSRRNTNMSNDAGKPSRRFSLMPSSLSKTFSQRESMSGKAPPYAERRDGSARRRTSSKSAAVFGRGHSRSPSQSTTSSARHGFYDGPHDSNSRIRNAHAAGPSSAPAQQTQFDHGPSAPPIGDEKFPNPLNPHPSQHGRRPTDDSDFDEASGRNPYAQGMGGGDEHQQRKGVLQKSRKFQDAYEDGNGNKGSSGSSKRVMDFFRRMGKQRTVGR